jgi:hypothetical protein
MDCRKSWIALLECLYQRRSRSRIEG